MPFVIMKTYSSPVALDYTIAHAVWEGSMAEAQAFCEEQNAKPSTRLVEWHVQKVKTLGPVSKPPPTRDPLKCALCKRPESHHSSVAGACPMGRRDRTLGYLSYHPINRFTPKP